MFRPNSDDLTTSPEETREVWLGHFNGVLSVPVVLTDFRSLEFDGYHTKVKGRSKSAEYIIANMGEYPVQNQLDGEFSIEQVHKAIDKLREDAKPGKQNRPAYIFKRTRESKLAESLRQIANACLQSRTGVKEFRDPLVAIVPN